MFYVMINKLNIAQCVAYKLGIPILFRYFKRSIFFASLDRSITRFCYESILENRDFSLIRKSFSSKTIFRIILCCEYM